jgi:hypothetical protein
MLLKSESRQPEASYSMARAILQILYSPYFGSLSSSISNCMESGDGRTKHKHLRWRMFSLFWLSRRLFTIRQILRAVDEEDEAYSVRYTSWPKRADCVVAAEMI